MAKTTQSKRKKAVTVDDLAMAGGFRVHENGDIELLSEREAQALISEMFREAAANLRAPNERRKVLH
ncbi:MAG TPA: hypothetical protein VE999_12300 [Gemmataceae bacterium]|nr:hypothetical protein [Gemmataceae bacterium]